MCESWYNNKTNGWHHHFKYFDPNSLTLFGIMSTTTTEEDTELRDLVATTLENAGVLGKIKAD